MERDMTFYDSQLLDPKGTEEKEFFVISEETRKRQLKFHSRYEHFFNKGKHLSPKASSLSKCKLKIYGIMIEAFRINTLAPGTPLYYMLRYGIVQEGDKAVSTHLSSQEMVPLFQPPPATLILLVNGQIHFFTPVAEMLNNFCSLPLNLSTNLLPNDSWSAKIVWPAPVPFDPQNYNNEHVFVKVFLGLTMVDMEEQ